MDIGDIYYVKTPDDNSGKIMQAIILILYPHRFLSYSALHSLPDTVKKGVWSTLKMLHFCSASIENFLHFYLAMDACP